MSKEKEHKVKVARSGSFGFPMPVVMVGADVNGKPNFLTAAWVMKAEANPPKIAFALAPHYTNIGIEEHGECSINIPGRSLVREADCCGMYSGEKHDKSCLFSVYRGELAHAPMAGDCPVTMECRIDKTVPLDRHTLYIADVINIYADSSKVDGTGSQNTKLTAALELDAILFTSSDTSYYAPGDFLGGGWRCGREVLAGQGDTADG